MQRVRVAVSRHFAVGDLVAVRHESGEFPDKTRAPWDAPFRVVSRIFQQQYIVDNGFVNGRRHVHINSIKSISLPSTSGWVASPIMLQAAARKWAFQLGEVLFVEGDSECGSAQSWGDRVVYVESTVTSKERMEKLWALYDRHKPAQLLLMVPALWCDEWFRELQSGSEGRYVSAMPVGRGSSADIVCGEHTVLTKWLWSHWWLFSISSSASAKNRVGIPKAGRPALRLRKVF